MAAVHQFIATFEPGAIGNHALEVQRTLRGAGYESEIFAEFTRPPFEDQAHVHTDYDKRAKQDDILLYHMAIGSNVASYLLSRPERVVLIHHNITPVEYYEPWDPGVTYGMAWGRNQLRELAPRTTLGLAVSEYNRRELEALHYRRTAVVPITVDFAAFDHSVDDEAVQRLRDAKGKGGYDWLFVGWIAPHKCQHDIIRAFAAYKQMYNDGSRLHIVGRTGLEVYREACEKLIAELGLQDSATLHGQVTDGELGAFYRESDVLVCMSEHEGVGIPLLEAMHHNLPIVAYAAAAVPETVGNAGIVLPRKRPATVAAAVHRVLSDKALQTALAEAQRERIVQFSVEKSRGELLAALRILD